MLDHRAASTDLLVRRLERSLAEYRYRMEAEIDRHNQLCGQHFQQIADMATCPRMARQLAMLEGLMRAWMPDRSVRAA